LALGFVENYREFSFSHQTANQHFPEAALLPVAVAQPDLEHPKGLRNREKSRRADLEPPLDMDW